MDNINDNSKSIIVQWRLGLSTGLYDYTVRFLHMLDLQLDPKMFMNCLGSREFLDPQGMNKYTIHAWIPTSW